MLNSFTCKIPRLKFGRTFSIDSLILNSFDVVVDVINDVIFDVVVDSRLKRSYRNVSSRQSVFWSLLLRSVWNAVSTRTRSRWRTFRSSRPRPKMNLLKKVEKFFQILKSEFWHTIYNLVRDYCVVVRKKVVCFKT
jgi:hypothetical protein